jgi:hypothetical protein
VVRLSRRTVEPSTHRRIYAELAKSRGRRRRLAFSPGLAARCLAAAIRATLLDALPA